MMTERGRVVAVEPDAVWVETIRRSSCQSCSARKGCGHGLLESAGLGRPNHVRALLGACDPDAIHIDDTVEISVPEQVVLTGIAVIYLLPLLTTVGGLLLGGQWGDAEALVGALAGLAAGFGLMRLHARLIRNDRRFQPVVVACHPAVALPCTKF
jgi:sigma-E factor negative regulatory protein RseC